MTQSSLIAATVVDEFELRRGSDLIEVQILSDGRIKILTPGEVTPENHANADDFLKAMATLGHRTESVEARGDKNKLRTHHHHHKVNE